MNSSEDKDKKGLNFTVGGNWDKQTVKLKEKYTQLTDSDLKFEKGKESEMLGRVQSKLNKNREEVIKIINETKVAPENDLATDKVS